MYKIVFISVILFFTTYSCNDSEVNNLPSTEQPFLLQEEVMKNENEIEFNGNTIEVNKSLENNSEIVDQTIELIGNDFLIKTKKITSKFYFINKGISGVDLENAILDTEQEQLFYVDLRNITATNILKNEFGEDLTEAIAYLSFEIKNDFLLITEKGEEFPALYAVHESSSRLTPYERILLSFPIQSNGEYKIIYKDNLFGKGDFTFHFPSENNIESNFN